ncbi:MAG: hypothetical protein ACLRZX_15000, partial [Coprobacillus cateniformis]
PMHVEMINGMIKNGFNASGNPNITGSIIEKIAAGIERIANFFRNLTFENNININNGQTVLVQICK